MQAGWVDLPTVPGLGMDIDAEQLRKRPYQQFPNRRMRHYWEEFPRKDYVTGAAH
jgi:galactonate dehydratase